MSTSKSSLAKNGLAVGDILVVRASNFLRVPAFFRIVKGNSPDIVQLRALGSAADENGLHSPDGTEHYDSLCKTAHGKVNTWCGNAVKWDGVPC